MTDTSTVAVSRPRRAMRSPAAPAEAAPQTERLAPPEIVVETTEGPQKFVRQPFAGRRQRLDNAERPGFHRHWFNDDAGRIEDALRAGYTHVKDSTGNNMKRVVGVAREGGGQIAYRMEIPLEWYDADQKLKDQNRAEQLAQLRRGVAAGHAPGQDGAYQPTNKAGGIGAEIKNAR